MDKPKLWTKDFLILSFVNFFVALNSYLLLVVISVYAMVNFDSSPSEAGLASSIFLIGALIARLLAGKLLEQIGRKKMLYIGLIAGLIMTLLYFGVNSVMLLYVIRFLNGAAFGIITTAAGTIIVQIIPKQRCGEGIGYFMLSVTLATAIGPFLGIFINQYGSFNMIFVACAISAALSLLTTFFLNIPEVVLTEAQLEELKGFKFNNFFEPKAIPISIIGAVLYFCYSSIVAFLTPYSIEIGLVDAASIFFIFFSASSLFSRPFSGRLTDLKGENFTMYPGMLIFMIGMIILSQAHQGYALLLAGAFIGFGFGTARTGSQAIAIKLTPPHRMGLANSTFYFFLDAGMGIGPYIFGLLIPFTGYRGVFLCVAIVAWAGLFLYYQLHGKNAIPVIRENSLAK